MSTPKESSSPGAEGIQGTLPGFESGETTPTNPMTTSSAFSFQYQPSGPHGQIRWRLMRAQAILSEDVPFGLSRLAVGELGRALRSFLEAASLLGVAGEALSSSRSGPGTRSGRFTSTERAKFNQARRDRERSRKLNK